MKSTRYSRKLEEILNIEIGTCCFRHYSPSSGQKASGAIVWELVDINTKNGYAESEFGVRECIKEPELINSYGGWPW